MIYTNVLKTNPICYKIVYKDWPKEKQHQSHFLGYMRKSESHIVFKDMPCQIKIYWFISRVMVKCESCNA